jgi:hypothetical protein
MSTWTSAIPMISASLRFVTGTHSPDRSQTICSVASDFSLVYRFGLFGSMTSSFETRSGRCGHTSPFPDHASRRSHASLKLTSGRYSADPSISRGERPDLPAWTDRTTNLSRISQLRPNGRVTSFFFHDDGRFSRRSPALGVGGAPHVEPTDRPKQKRRYGHETNHTEVLGTLGLPRASSRVRFASTSR